MHRRQKQYNYDDCRGKICLCCSNGNIIIVLKNLCNLYPLGIIKMEISNNRFSVFLSFWRNFFYNCEKKLPKRGKKIGLFYCIFHFFKKN